MGAINGPTNEKREIPDNAKGNPVYEQTRQDMPLWCCGRNCGRNSRITVFILGIIGIFSSIIVCLSPHYFRYESLRNDTFTHEEMFQPKPFRYATEANVGLFRYQILDVFEFPWPPDEQRELFDAMHNRELERLARLDLENERVQLSTGFNFFDRFLQKKFPDAFYDDDDDFSGQDYRDFTDDDNISTDSGNITTHQNGTKIQQNDTMDIVLTRAPADSPFDIDGIPPGEIPDVIPGSSANERFPTSSPTPSPTGVNPNDLIEDEIGVVKPYPAGSEFDKLFKQGQSGAMWAPILASIGLIFASIEFFCCVYKCSWLPTAIFLYIAFMLQLMTMFLFMTEDFCDYTQKCWLGSAGYMSVIAVVCYLICQMLVCMTPRPPPKYNLLKKPPVRRKKKKKKKPNEFADDDEKDSFAGSSDRFNDESSYGGSSRNMDPYYDQDPYNNQNDNPNGYSDGYKDDDGNGYDDGYGDGYNGGYDQDGYNNGYDEYDGSYDKTDQATYDNANQSIYDSQPSYDNEAQPYAGYDDVGERSYDEDSKAYDDHYSADQGSYDQDSQEYDGYDGADQGDCQDDEKSHEYYKEVDEKPPSSTSSRRSKK